MSLEDKRLLSNAELERILEELDSDEEHITLAFDPQSDSDSDLENAENNGMESDSDSDLENAENNGMEIDDEFGDSACDIDNTSETDLNQNPISENAYFKSNW
ncbi:hypothetical protein QE152_g33740 [Popillia japonica]|uniref:Uncharacterized protein n=1 Tax=Popillia japonica TaxID=7064 RepID=A0AAW1IVN1_POPJA